MCNSLHGGCCGHKGMPFEHESIRHSVGEYVNGMAHSNEIESFFGVTQARMPRHLPSYEREAFGPLCQRGCQSPQRPFGRYHRPDERHHLRRGRKEVVLSRFGEVIAPMREKDVERALDQIDRNGISSKNRSTKYCLVARGRGHYPPKVVLSLASDTKVSDLKGGPKTNKQLERLHYRINKCGCRNIGVPIH